MAKQKRFIPNPNKMSNTEQSFISKETKDIALTEELNTKDKYKGRMISMSDSFYQQLNNYLKNHCVENLSPIGAFLSFRV